MKQKRNYMRKKLLAHILVPAVFLSSAFATVQTTAAGKIRLNQRKVSLKVGKTVKLKLYGTKKKVRWTSKKKSVATVSKVGKVRAKKAGKAKIIAKVAGKKYTCQVTVLPKKNSFSKAENTPERIATSSPVPEQPGIATPLPTVTQTSVPTLGPTPNITPQPVGTMEPSQKKYTFRSDRLLEEHYQKHGLEMGFSSKEAYVAAANVVIHSPDALHKLEAEDGDDVYYLEATNEFVIVSTDGYIRTYFYPSDGKDYFDRQ